MLAAAVLAPHGARAEGSQLSAKPSANKNDSEEKTRENASEESSGDAEEDKPHVSGSLSGDELGGVTYVGARLDIPIGKFSLIPQFELLHVFAQNADQEDELNPYFGGGIGFRPSDSLSLEASCIVGPTSFNVGSVGGVFGLSQEIGADWDNDKPPVVELDAEAAVTYFSWENGQGPAGSDVVQSYLSLEALIRAGKHLELTPKAMGFLYDKTFAEATGERIDGLPVLARVGSFAPRAMVGARIGYKVAWLTPFVEVDEIVYAAGIGDASELVGGAKFQVGKESSILAGGGLLDNRVSGPLVAADAAGVLPVGLLEVELQF